MASKLKYISDLADWTAREVTQNAGNWKQYLKTAARLYKYGFDDQLLIYAQRPGAVACASFEVWNGTMHRWVRGGSKGIALIRKRRDGSRYLDHVFDVADTRPVEGAREPWLWEMRQEYHGPVAGALGEKYGITGVQAMSLPQCLMAAAEKAVGETYREHLRDLEYDASCRFPKGLGGEGLAACFRETLAASVQYALLARCGFRPEDHLDDGSLGGIAAFSDPAALHHLGDACSGFIMGLCVEIRNEIWRLEFGDRQKGGREKAEQEKTAKGLENSPGIGYTEDRREFNTLIRESKDREGGEPHGSTGIQESGGLLHPRSDDGRGGRGEAAHREVWAAQGEFPAGTPPRDIHLDAPDGEAGRTSAGGREADTGTGGQPAGGADESRRGGREAESGEPTAVGAEGQRADGPGGGNGAAGDRLPLSAGREADVKGARGATEKEGLGEPGKPAEKEEPRETEKSETRGKEETAGEHPAVFALSGEGSGQLSLFPTVEEQAERIAQAQAEEQREQEGAEPCQGIVVPGVPESVVCRILTSGGNGRNSILRIVAFYQKSPEMAEAAAFLKKEYGCGGKGVTVAGKKYALWFDGDGIRISPGRRVGVPGTTLVPWERAAVLVQGLLDNGTFATREKLDGARENEFQRLAASLWYLYQDTGGRAREKGFLPYLAKLYGGFPESTARIEGLIREKAGRDVLMAELGEFARAYGEDRGLMRYHLYKPGAVLEELAWMDIEPRQFDSVEGFVPVNGSFITEDEIDRMLMRGNYISNGKMRICSYFMQGHDAKERAAFLRKEYGTGGSYHTGHDQWHDAKGIKFRRDDEASGYAGYDTVFMGWHKVQQRVGALIGAGKYLNQKETEYMPEYEKQQLARKLYAFQYYTPSRSANSGVRSWDVQKGERDFRPMLDSLKYSTMLYEDMVETFAPLTPDVRGYEEMEKALQDMAAFLKGEYSLFRPLSESALQAEREKTRRKAEAEKGDAANKISKIENRGIDTDAVDGNVEAQEPEDEAPREKTTESPKQEKATESSKKEKPKGELETAARTLAGKQRAKTKEGVDGQLSFDFAAMSIAWAESREADGEAAKPEPGKAVQERQPGQNAPEGKTAGRENVREAPDLENGAGAEESQEMPEPAETEPNLAPDVEGYLNLKVQHPDKLIGVRVGSLYLFYGKDAEAAAPALGTKLLKQEIPGLGETSVTGTGSWQKALKNLLEHGNSVLIVRPEAGKGAPYVTVKERDIADYIPLGMQITVEGRRMEIDSVDFGKGKVSLKDLGMGNRFPIFREEPIDFVRECIEQEAGREAEVVPAAPDAPNMEEAAAPDDPDMEEAKRLIGEFCFYEYGGGGVDFGIPEHIGIAYTTVGDEEYELQVEVNLLDFSVSQLLDGVCISRRGYGSLRELIDEELKELNFDELVSVDWRLLEAFGQEKAGGRTREGQKEREEQERQEKQDGQGKQEGQAESAPQGRPVPSERVQVYDAGLPFEVVVRKLATEPERERVNYHITDDGLGAWGQKTRYQNNVAAVRLLKEIEAQGRPAELGEQEVLARYTGWGGLSQAFDPDNGKWAAEYAELKGLLGGEEYESARSTVLNAFYTSPPVIKAVYEAVGRMGFVPGNVLEPSCGVGNFFGLAPKNFQESQMYGVELDGLTGRLAAQLYQRADIRVGGFETADFPDDFFDLALGNVPFGEYRVADRRYDRMHLLIHDYFLVKTLDKVRPGGIMAFVTSKGTMDKADAKARKALAQKADLLGAVRLPNNAFKDNAGTEVTADILFFQKRGSAPEQMPEWVTVGQTEEGIPLNNYFLQHPEMVLGRMSFWKNMYGSATETACLPVEGADLSAQLAEAVGHIAPPDRAMLLMDGREEGPDRGEGAGDGVRESIAAEPGVRNFSFTVKGGKLYFRENSRMALVETGKMQAERIRGMIGIRDSARRLIEIQTGGASDGEVKEEQARLNALYDSFTKKYGLLNSAGNRLAFRQDSSYPLLCSLEVLDEEGHFCNKADMFTKRTIRHRQPVTRVDTAVEALGVSIGERACVDLGFMASLMGGEDKIPQIVEDLKGIIFKDPASGPFDLEGGGDHWYAGWQAADAYLSGNVREKLQTARAAAGEYPEFAVNVESLEKVQPKDLTAPEISVRIGAPWVDLKYYREFLFELLKTPGSLRGKVIDVLYSDVGAAWNVKGKYQDNINNTRAYGTYGTRRVNAYEIFEASLNQKSVEVYDTVDVDGKEKRVLNAKETAIAQQKQEAMKGAFQEWIFKDPERRAELCDTYNRLFNAVRPREYDGQHIQFVGMNPEIRLEEHQKNAVARVLYGGNTLLAHVVGAGKTFECIAAAMEGKRLGLCRKSMMVVPNHLTEQWGSDFLTLYPGAKVLVATKRDFEPKNRRKFCARIATGDYDAVIIGHTQFEKIPISPERQKAHLRNQISEAMEGIEEAKSEKQERWTIRQMEQTKKGLEEKLKRLDGKKRDDTVYFEELGVDRIFVDEAQYYKNLYTYTRMRNVAGIGQADAQKSSDMYAKCRYMDEITGGKGIIFATGTPISNTMVELYTMMRYLQDGLLREGYRDSAGKVHSLQYFDNWAATFGEQVTAVELKPEGTGFRLKTRFARFYNLPELMNLWKEAADIQTADMLNLPTPEAEYVTIQTEPSAAQKKMVEALAERAERIRGGGVDANVDNMLKVTSDGRKLALDQRLMNPLLADDPGSKVNACVENVFRIWTESADFRGTQLIFSDLSTPRGRKEPVGNTEEKGGGEPKEGQEAGTGREETAGKKLEEQESVQEYGVYTDIREKLIAKGIPAEQIAFIHDAHTEAQKAELFAKVRKGQVRVLLGSTQKMGAGTNVQTLLVASHDLDCPWRPADLEQRAGRIVRRGNRNKKVWIYHYVTKGTFDAYTWGLVENKQKFIGQVMTSKSPARSIEDVDATALSYAEVKMLATGDPRIKEKMDLDIQVAKLKMLKANHTALQYDLEDRIRGYFPNKMKETQLYIDCLEADMPVLEAHPAKEDAFAMTVMGTAYTERKEAGAALIAACRLLDNPDKEIELGEYRGFPMRLGFNGEKFEVTMKRHLTYTAELSDDMVGNIVRINNALEKIPQSLDRHRENLARLAGELESAREEAERPFPQEAELAEKSARLTELNTELDNEERNRGKEPEQDGAEQDSREKVSAPGSAVGDNNMKPDAGKGAENRSRESRVAESSGWENTGARAGGKSSILAELRQHERTVPVPAGRVQSRGGEAI